MKTFNLLEELCETFGVKKNPVVSFWFCREEYINDNSADYPEDFEQYNLYQKKKFWMDDKIWCCYVKKEVRGCFSENYWKR